MILYLRRSDDRPDALRAERAKGEARNPEQSDDFLREAFLDYARRRHISVPESRDLHVARGVRGKPYFDTPSLSAAHFSVSHSGRFWAVLFHGTAVGLDVEDLSAAGRRGKHDRARFERIAARFFAPDEQAYLAKAGDAPDCRERFFRIWTRKEAYVKYTGDGFAQTFSHFSVIAPIALNTPNASNVPNAPNIPNISKIQIAPIASETPLAPADSSASESAAGQGRAPDGKGGDDGGGGNGGNPRPEHVYDMSGAAIPGAYVFDLPIDGGIRCACCCDGASLEEIVRMPQRCDL
jgi:phosphopantetheinyl transferase